MGAGDWGSKKRLGVWEGVRGFRMVVGVYKGLGV